MYTHSYNIMTMPSAQCGCRTNWYSRCLSACECCSVSNLMRFGRTRASACCHTGTIEWTWTILATVLEIMLVSAFAATDGGQCGPVLCSYVLLTATVVFELGHAARVAGLS